MKTAIIAFVAAVIVLGGALYLYKSHTTYETNGTYQGATTTQTTTTGTPVTTTPAATSTGQTNAGDIRVTSPTQGATITSPLTLTGSAKGSWFFEATAPVYLADATGKHIAEGHITATGDWMTTNFVPFTGVLAWSATSTNSTSTLATLVFMNDNPSGDPSLQKTVTVPVVLSR